MNKYLPVVVCMAWFGSLFGCSRNPKEVAIDQLKFPVIRILESSSDSHASGQARVFLNKEDLNHIPVQELWNVTNPLIIDSNANVLEMRDIKNEHGGFWTMLHPQGQMPVTFTLRQSQESGIAAARKIIANCRFLGRDLDGERTELRRERIRSATNGDEIIQIILEAAPSTPPKVVIDPPNAKGFAKISIREGDDYQEGIVDANGNEVVQASSKLLVDDITGSLALVRFERKSLFVPLDGGYISAADLANVNGFQSAEPYSCGLAKVILNDVHFYLDSNFEKAFGLDFEFAESFHLDRAYVRVGDRHRIIDTQGKTVAELNYDQVNPQSPWCWQVTKIEGQEYRSGFVDLNGNLLTELIYDGVGYYDPEVRRIRVSRNGLHGFLDEHAKVAIPVKYERVEAFQHGKAKVVLDGRTFFINPDGLEVSE